MKYVLLQFGVLVGVAVLIAVVGRAPVLNYWGALGWSTLRSATVICLVPALVAATVVGLAATYAPQRAPLAALAGTAVRLLLTMAIALGYQVHTQPPLVPFLWCMVVAYLALLAAETGLIVWIVSRVSRRQTTNGAQAPC